ncbi:hypothetical protein ABZ819_05155 [Streptomyces venezuelae]|uniref:hypothetical protein n=1 Tax=Streptomyces venezuelae TaxID=54571 RepID=UPI0034429261
MVDPYDAPFASVDEHLRGMPDLVDRWSAFLHAAEQLDMELEAFRKRQRQEIALGFRAEGKKWKEIGKIMGDVTYQRAFQYGKGE